MVGIVERLVQRWFTQEAERLAEQAARIAANPPNGQPTTSGDLTRLIAEATYLLKHAATIEAGLKAVGLMSAETATAETKDNRPPAPSTTMAPPTARTTDAQSPQDVPADPIYDDGAHYGPTTEQ